MKDFELTMRLKNNRLKQRREELGMSQKRFAEAVGITHGTYNAFENMRMSPLTARGDWSETACKLASFHGLTVGDLFPAAVLSVQRSQAVRKLSADEARALCSVAVEPDDRLESDQRRTVVTKALQRLTSREAEVVRRRFGLGCAESTLQEIADGQGCGKERIRQIEMKALHELRQGEALRDLRTIVDDRKPWRLSSVCSSNRRRET